MGIFSGNLSYMRYFVEGTPPIENRDDFIERIQLYAIPELTADNEDEQVTGWTLTESVLDTEFSIEKVFHNEYIIFSFRIDSWKIPAALQKAHQVAAERAHMEEQNREKLGKREKNLIKDKVRKELKNQTLPNLATYDVCWHPESGILRFWSLSARSNEMFVELFEKTFGLQLTPQTPYTIAERCGFEEEELVQMVNLEPQVFVEGDEEDFE